MKVNLDKGRYVVAVSGGVDSVVLLDLLKDLPGVQLTVAHFDHGIRADSLQDRVLVQKLALQYDIPFAYDSAALGPDASEDVARRARYEFLHKVRVAAKAKAIITAHHQDDMLETAVINLLRGTGSRGLSSLKSRDRVVRPLLEYTKTQIKSYATEHGLKWREDSTNLDQKYLRNYVRIKILCRFTPEQRQTFLDHVLKAGQLNSKLETAMANQLHIQPAVHMLDRHWFIGLPHNVAREVLATWLRERGVNYDKKTLERLVTAAKTYEPGKKADVNMGYFIEVGQDFLALSSLDR